MPLLPSVSGQTQAFEERDSDCPTLPISQKVTRFSGPEAARNETVTGLVSKIFNESFGYRPDGRPYRLGPKSTAARLASTDFLFIAGDEQSGIGYLFGKEIPFRNGRIAWIESMAVLPLYRKQGVATALIQTFRLATKGALKIGCATPNPIAALVVTRTVPGKLYIGNCSPPTAVLHMLREIREYCFDLRGCAIQGNTLRIKTGFSPLSRSDEREWNPRTPSSPPHWWSELEHLKNDYEALLVIERTDIPSTSLHSAEYANEAPQTQA
jgi:GNAT superfamily N-acetyltransferase